MTKIDGKHRGAPQATWGDGWLNWGSLLYFLCRTKIRQSSMQDQPNDKIKKET